MQRVAIGSPRCPKVLDKRAINITGKSWVDADTTEYGWSLRSREKHFGPQEAPVTFCKHT